MNVIDKAVSIISPKKGLERITARKAIDVFNTGYSNHGANTFKKSVIGWFFRGGSVKQDVYKNRNILVQRSRDLYMGAPLATGALKTIVKNVIGSGLKLKSTLDFESLGLTREKSQIIQQKLKKNLTIGLRVK